MLFHYRMKKFSTLSKNAIISISLLFLKLRKSTDVCTNLRIAVNGRFSTFVVQKPLVTSHHKKTVRCETPQARTQSRGFRRVPWSVLSNGAQPGSLEIQYNQGGVTLEKIA
jgi:hypothetical protein